MTTLMVMVISLAACGDQPAAGPATAPFPPAGAGGTLDRAVPKPDLSLTPGAILPGVGTEELCRPGYASTVTPPAAADVEAVYEAYRVADGRRSEYSLDHLVPVGLGGAAERANLWPMPAGGSMGVATKEGVARILIEAVCTGQVDLEAAQRAMVADWPIAYSSTAPLPRAPTAVAVPGPTAPPPPPGLTPAQEQQIRTVVQGDPGVGHLLAEGRMGERVAPVYGEDRDLLGGAVTIGFDPPLDLRFEAPLEGCIDGRRRRVLQRYEVDRAHGVVVSVLLADGGRVYRAHVPPSGPPEAQPTIRTTVVRDLQPPGERCRLQRGD